LRAVAAGNFGQFLRPDRLDILAAVAQLGIPQDLRYIPVLTEITMQVAAKHAKGEGPAARQQMVKGFLLHRVSVGGGYIAPGHSQFALPVASDVADSLTVRVNQAAVGTGCAAQVAVLERLKEHARGGEIVGGVVFAEHGLA
jgi:hypothetical protein